jgi:hypothetical protein
MKWSFLFICVMLSMQQALYSQKQSSFNAGTDNIQNCGCTYILKKVSHNWQLDSNGGNGYRQSVYKQLKDCKPDGITKDTLLKILGRANHIFNYRDGSSDVSYDYYNAAYIDTSKTHFTHNGFDCIGFIFSTTTNKLINISSGFD